MADLKQGQHDEPSFAELFEAQEQEGKVQLSAGQKLPVSIVAITADTVFVSTGSKVDGIVDRKDLENEAGELPYAVGDALELYVVATSAQEVRLSTMLSGAGGLALLEEAKDAQLPVAGKVKAVVNGGYAVEVMRFRAFCPASQIDAQPVAEPESLVGQSFPFLITRIEKNGRNIVLNRRVLVEKELAGHREAYLATVAEGDIVEATVSRLVPFGMFVSLAPGVDALVHLSELSWARVEKAEDVYSVGAMIRGKILSLGENDKGKIALSIRQATENPWSTQAAALVAGSVVPGKVTRFAPFGAFVELAPGIEGLVHLSELSYERRIMKADTILALGQEISVKIIEADIEKQRISLSYRAVGGDPWDTVTERFAPGQAVQGTLEKRAPFGYFITLSPGITGLLPNAAVASAKQGKSSFDKLSSGAAVDVLIATVSMESKRISLTLPGSATQDAAEEKDWKRHAPKQSAAPFGGNLGSALQAALKKK